VAGTLTSPEPPAGKRSNIAFTRNGATLVFQMTGQPAVALEATAQDRFKVGSADIVIEFDAAKNQMIIKRRGGQERVLTKEK